MAEDLLGQLVPAVDAVHDLQWAAAGALDGPLLQPGHELLRLRRQPQAQEGVNGEGGVAHPGVAVVPVAHPADLLRQPAGRRRHDRAGRRERQQLQHQRRAVDHLAPAA